ncbi:2-iminoacetate synthase ThiH [Aquimarina brevivitae]|uniref:Tyrosine lyase ThiH n=1 Tax=Aquimarina brevivitae TaxID=323412 RepID=A0A4Q7PI16_9FLAO|nr:2-iminoacetate synthase ThiH [Aquimarina brevivitae]RZS99608.1 tyrosine lyase ThiH [Aquimarina brevivitae]
MSSFTKIIENYHWDSMQKDIYAKTAEDVIYALQKDKRTLDDFKALISPAAKPFIEQMAQKSAELTKKRFGNTMQMFAPLYLSNECQNICTYCGFSMTNKIRRRTLIDEEIQQEADYLKSKGFDHILLVTGEANKIVGVDYIGNAIDIIRDKFANISMEVQPMDQSDYEFLKAKGLYAVLVYQETYHRQAYKKHHPKGRKSNFEYRLTTPDRLGRAGIHKIGIGALFGLEDWRTDSFFTALHLRYLQKTYWKTKYAISFPRLRPHSGGLEPKVEMTDSDLVQLISAYRLLDEDVELSISTRETETFRNNIVNLGITSMSAASKTNPGGYVVETSSLEQFEISDERSTEQITEMLQERGLDVVWKDWDKTWC